MKQITLGFTLCLVSMLLATEPLAIEQILTPEKIAALNKLLYVGIGGYTAGPIYQIGDQTFNEAYLARIGYAMGQRNDWKTKQTFIQGLTSEKEYVRCVCFYALVNIANFDQVPNASFRVQDTKSRVFQSWLKQFLSSIDEREIASKRTRE